VTARGARGQLLRDRDETTREGVTVWPGLGRRGHSWEREVLWGKLGKGHAISLLKDMNLG